MKAPNFRKAMAVILGLFAVAYVVLVLTNNRHPIPMNDQTTIPNRAETVTVFGATGTIGDGLLKAAINDRGVRKIHVVTRRLSPRMEMGQASGRVVVHMHEDYLDYSTLRDVLAESDAIFWAIGITAVGLDEDTYRQIHNDFPEKALREWMNVSNVAGGSFHYVSGAGANRDSRMMWARLKAEAEADLSAMVADSNLRVVSYRPSFITPTEAEIKWHHKVANAILSPTGSVIRAEEIGEGMLEAARLQLANGTVLENRDILKLSEAYNSDVDD